MIRKYKYFPVISVISLVMLMLLLNRKEVLLFSSSPSIVGNGMIYKMLYVSEIISAGDIGLS